MHKQTRTSIQEVNLPGGMVTIITGYDPFVVVLDTDGKQQVIYKHAISTIVPIRPVELWEAEEPVP